MGKLPDIETLLELKKRFTLEQIAQMFGVTRQYVWITLNQSPDYYKQQYSKKEQIERRNQEIRRLWQEGKTGQELAEMFGVSINTIYRAKDGAKHKLQIGCDNCKSQPYARGYCKKCYSKLWRAEKRERESVHVD